jgi:hypothetical protein
MESPCNPKTPEELHDALDRLLIRADKNGLLGNRTTTDTFIHDDPDTRNWEVLIHQM